MRELSLKDSDLDVLWELENISLLQLAQSLVHNGVLGKDILRKNVGIFNTEVRNAHSSILVAWNEEVLREMNLWNRAGHNTRERSRSNRSLHQVWRSWGPVAHGKASKLRFTFPNTNLLLRVCWGSCENQVPFVRFVLLIFLNFRRFLTIFKVAVISWGQNPFQSCDSVLAIANLHTLVALRVLQVEIVRLVFHGH